MGKKDAQKDKADKTDGKAKKPKQAKPAAAVAVASSNGVAGHDLAVVATASPNGATALEPPVPEPAGPPTFRERQRALKDAYRADPRLARQVSSVHSVTHPHAETGKVRIAIDSEAGVILDVGAHHSVGGIEDVACSGDIFLASLAACYEITLRLVAAASKVSINKLDLHVEGDWDARGTLGLDRNTPVGFTGIRVSVNLEADGPADRLASLCAMTEKYCVVSQTLRHPPILHIRHQGVLLPQAK